MKKIFGLFLIIYGLIFILSSCGVATKNKRRTVAMVKCYDRELFDFRQKYEVKERKIEMKNKRFLKQKSR